VLGCSQRVMDGIDINLSPGDFLEWLSTWATNRVFMIAGERSDEKCKLYVFDHGATGNVLIVSVSN
jgi:hypothetical protein